MSDKTNRKSGAERRQEQYLRESREKKKIGRMAIIVALALVVLFAGALLVNSNYIRRNSVAVSAGSLKFSPAEFDYFYNSAYTEYQYMIYENMPDSASTYLPAQGVPLDRQVYDSSTGQTWDEFFESSAMNTISEIAATYDEAQRVGFTLTDEKRAEMESNITALRDNADLYGYKSLTKYLQYVYGPTMNESVMIRLSELLYIANSYTEHVMDSFTYTDDELAAYYDENKDIFDTFTYRYFLISAESVLESDYDTTEEYDQAKADAIAEAVRQGEEIAADIKSEQDFIDAARTHNSESYDTDDSTLRHYKGEMLGSTQGPWLREAERKYGDVGVIEFSNGCYVQMFIDRAKNEYNLVNLRQLLIIPETVSPEDYPEGEDDVAYKAAVAQSKTDAQEEAETALAALEAGGGTEETFLELIAQYSDDVTEGGLYENVFRYETGSRLVAEVNEWPFVSERKVGDYELVSDENGNQYIVFLSSFGELYNKYLSENGIRNRDFDAWDEALERPEIKTHWAFSLKS